MLGDGTRVLVTGGTGFVGHHLVQKLVERGCKVRVLARSRSPREVLAGCGVEFCDGDITEPESLARAVEGREIVFHVAALIAHGRAKAAKLQRVNVEGTRNMVQAALAAGVRRFVHTSSVAAVGVPVDPELPADERFPFNADRPGLPYFRAKRAAELEVMGGVAKGLDAVMVNPGVILGPGDHRFTSGRVFQILGRMPLPLSPPGGTGVVDVRDVAEGHLAAAERGRRGERYILVGENITWKNMLGIASRTLGRPDRFLGLPAFLFQPLSWGVDLAGLALGRRLPGTGELLRLGARYVYYDSGLARRELGMVFRDFETSARDAADWYQAKGLI